MSHRASFAVSDSWVQAEVCCACQLGTGRGLLSLTVGPRARFAVSHSAGREPCHTRPNYHI